ncbi:MAG: hypothetical protein ACJASX_002979, partial [Limisphaerales bacterium]
MKKLFSIITMAAVFIGAPMLGVAADADAPSP